MTIPCQREAVLDNLAAGENTWDVIVIGGGATGVAVALDAASRGLSVVLLERHDFGCGTSSRSTKLVHGGVRYLKQGNITLVRDALRERSLLKRNAPHRVSDQAFLIPCANWWQCFFYAVGLKLYDLLAVHNTFGRSRFVSASQARQMSPALAPNRLRGAVVYHDGQFDDARLLIEMAITATRRGACLMNYVGVTDLTKSSDGIVNGVQCLDRESGRQFVVRGSIVVNAGGPFCDAVREMDDPNCEPMIAASQGIHLVFPRTFYPGETAMIVPKTSDGRVIFIVPWKDHAIVGTTDTAIPEAVAEPSPQPQEIQFLLETAAMYLAKPPTIDDVLSVFTGIRPLVKGDKSSRTASLSRDHVIRVAPSQLVTLTGGKWTTVRKMAEDCVDRVVQLGSLSAEPCATASLPIVSRDDESIATLEQQRPELAERIHPELPIRKSEIVWATRNEMARTIEDVLARRTRALFLNVAATRQCAGEVAQLMAAELGRDDVWCQQQVAALAKVADHFDVGKAVQI